MFELEMEKKNRDTEVSKYKKVVETIEKELTQSKELKASQEQKILAEYEQKTAQL